MGLVLALVMMVSLLGMFSLTASAADGTPVAKVGEVEYTDFATAVENWTDGTTLTLLADTPEYTDNITIVNKSVTLDLNGYALNFSSTESKKFMVGEYDGAGGSLTIRDSGTGGAINAYSSAVYNYGTANLQNGTLNGSVQNNGTFNITGGKVIGYRQSESRWTTAIGNDGTLNISGGEVTGRYAVWAGYDSVTNISGSPVITGKDQGTNGGSAIGSGSTDLVITISGTPTLKGGSQGELYSDSPITLNTQPADGETWRVLGTAKSIRVHKGVFAIPGEGVTLNPEKFVSLTEGYTVKKNIKGELVLCDCATGLVFVSNGDGTHNTTCSCGSVTFETNLACSGGVATDTLQAYCEYCNASYGALNPDVHYDITALTMTAEELENALLELLNAGETDISILLAAEPNKDMLIAINTALRSSTAADGSISLTVGGVKTIPNCEFMGNGNPTISKNTDVCEVKTITLPNATTLEMNALAYCRNLEAVYLPKVTNFGVWALCDCENLNTVVLTASGTITADFTSLETESIDLVLNCDKKNDVTNGNEWQSVTWKSIGFTHNYTDGICSVCGEVCDHKNSTYTDNGNGTHDRVCDECGYVEVDNEAHTGGTATCTTLAVCDTCGVSYGEVDTNNHDSSVECVNGFCPNGCYEPATLNAEGYYEIDNGGKLFWFAQQVNVKGNREIKGVLTADIDLENKPWTPIGETGENNKNFRGVFDGQNHTIKGLYVEGTQNGVGFFGEVRTGTVKNFTIYGEVVVNTEVDYVGGVIGSICGLNGENDLERNGAIIQNITSYVNLTAKVHGPGMIGGFVGYANHQSLIEKCSWYGTFDAREFRVDSGAGGFIGKIQENSSEVTIRNCAAYGTIKTNYAKNSYNNTPTIYMGGFLSFSDTGAKTTLENCLFAGKFERGANLTDEALLGAFGTLQSVNAIKNCYYLADDGLEAVHSDSPLNANSDNVEITAVTEDDLRNKTIATRLGEYWTQGENYPVIKK